MRKVLMVVIILLLSTQAQAQLPNLDFLKNLSTNHGVAYSFKNSNWNYITTTDLLSYKHFTLEAGFGGDADNSDNKIVGVLSFKLLDMSDVIKFPVLDKISFRPGVWFGEGHINQFEGKPDYGASLTVISFKF